MRVGVCSRGARALVVSERWSERGRVVVDGRKGGEEVGGRKRERVVFEEEKERSRKRRTNEDRARRMERVGRDDVEMGVRNIVRWWWWWWWWRRRRRRCVYVCVRARTSPSAPIIPKFITGRCLRVKNFTMTGRRLSSE